MRATRTTFLSVTAAACLMVSMSVPAMANASPEISTVGHLDSVSIEQDAPVGTSVVSASDLRIIGEQLSLEANLAVTDIIAADSERSINTVTWDKDSDVLTFYVYGDAAVVAERAADGLPAGQKWQTAPSVRPVSEVEAAIEKLASTPSALPVGATFVSGTPSPDGSTIDVGIERSGGMSMRSAEPLPQTFGDIPLSFTEEQAAEPALRSRSVAPVM